MFIHCVLANIPIVICFPIEFGMLYTLLGHQGEVFAGYHRWFPFGPGINLIGFDHVSDNWCTPEDNHCNMVELRQQLLPVEGMSSQLFE